MDTQKNAEHPLDSQNDQQTSPPKSTDKEIPHKNSKIQEDKLLWTHDEKPNAAEDGWKVIDRWKAIAANLLREDGT